MIAVDSTCEKRDSLVRKKDYCTIELVFRFSDGSCWEIIIIKRIHTFTSNILFEQRRFGLGSPGSLLAI